MCLWGHTILQSTRRETLDSGLSFLVVATLFIEKTYMLTYQGPPQGEGDKKDKKTKRKDHHQKMKEKRAAAKALAAANPPSTWDNAKGLMQKHTQAFVNHPLVKVRPRSGTRKDASWCF